MFCGYLLHVAADPYWSAWAELVDEFKQRLYERHPDRNVYQVELYAEVAALYEVCYDAAAKQQRQQQKQLQQQQQREIGPTQGSGSGDGGTAECAEPDAVLSLARVKFVWRIAGRFLLEMKRKAPEQMQLTQTTSPPPFLYRR